MPLYFPASCRHTVRVCTHMQLACSEPGRSHGPSACSWLHGQPQPRHPGNRHPAATGPGCWAAWPGSAGWGPPTSLGRTGEQHSSSHPLTHVYFHFREGETEAQSRLTQSHRASEQHTEMRVPE